jgi:hypothetical protein
MDLLASASTNDELRVLPRGRSREVELLLQVLVRGVASGSRWIVAAEATLRKWLRVEGRLNRERSTRLPAVLGGSFDSV